MNFVKCTRGLLVICFTLGVTIGARAAGTYNLTCDAANGAKIAITLTGFTFRVTNSGSGPGEASATGASANKRETTSDAAFELTIRFALGKDYETFLSMAQDNENLRSCKLTDGEGGGTTASDNWTQMSTTKGKSKNKNNEPAAASTEGALEWILTNARVTSVTAKGDENASGVPEGSMQATIEAQTFSFAD
jgi:hypothetical protein